MGQGTAPSKYVVSAGDEAQVDTPGSSGASVAPQRSHHEMSGSDFCVLCHSVVGSRGAESQERHS